MPEETPTPKPDPIAEWQQTINKEYKANVIQQGGGSSVDLQLSRFSSQILSLDCALGGGWVFGKIQTIAGEYSTGKTLMALKAAASVMDYDSTTKLHRTEVDADKFEPCKVLFIDVEHAFDEQWAIAHGWNPDLCYVAKPEYAEQAIDIVTDAIRKNIFGLIIIDSVAALTPSKEIEESSEDWQMGLGARLTNKAMRRWNASLAKMSQDHAAGGPAVISLNQFRLKLGVMFGDPRTMPNGKGQEFASSIIVYTKSAQVKDDDKAEHGFGEYGGVTWKNKTYIPRVNFKYRMALKDHVDWDKGTIDNHAQVMSLAKKHNIVVKDGTKWKVGTESFRVLKDIDAKLKSDPAFFQLLWRSIIAAYGGTAC